MPKLSKRRKQLQQMAFNNRGGSGLNRLDGGESETSDDYKDDDEVQVSLFLSVLSRPMWCENYHSILLFTFYFI